MFLRQVSDPALAQFAYLIGCQRSGEAIVIDPERDVDRYLALAAENHLRIVASAETHIHADYLGGSRELMERHGATVYVSAQGGPDWQFEWAKGKPTARFLHDGDVFKIGNIEIKALLTPGHTPEHMSFLVTDLGGGADQPIAFLTGDFIFVGDVGRPDLLESAAGQSGAMVPAARTLYSSLRATCSLPDHLQILPAHGAGSACGKALGAVPVSVLGYERRFNHALAGALHGSESDFVKDILSGQPEPPLYFARMKRDNRVGPALLPGGKLPAIPRWHPADLAAARSEKNLQILDLRTDRTAFMYRHLKRSLHAPMASGKLPVVAGSYVDENDPIVLITESAPQLEEAQRQLMRIGLDRIIAWLPAIEGFDSPSLETNEIRRISTAAMKEDLATHPEGRVLDVRSLDEFGESHVIGATHVAYTRLAKHLKEVPRGKPLYIHCGSGVRAALAAAYLARQDFDVVHVDGDFSEIAPELKTPGLHP